MARTTAVPKTATWTGAGTTSDALYLGDSTVLGIEMPGTFSGTTLAIHGCSTSGGTFAALQDKDAAAWSATVAANKRIYVDPLVTAGWPWIKLVSGSSEAAARTVALLCRPV